jgi:Zn-dependent protease with chaperone function
MAQRVAMQVPEQWVRALGDGTMAALDRAFGDDTTLAAERQAQLRAQFAALATSAGVDARFEFRAWPKLGANAFALPDGTIAVTDELVALAGDDRELIAVVAHELGHVHERHALQQLIAGSGVAALIFVLSGDTSGLSQIFVAAPTVLTQLRHSRALESDADRFALALLARERQDPAWFARIIRKLEDSPRQQDADSPGATGWLRSHPASEERARLAEEFAPPASG